LLAGHVRLGALPAGVVVDAEVDLGKSGNGAALGARPNVNLPGLDPSVARAIDFAADLPRPYSTATREKSPSRSSSPDAAAPFPMPSLVKDRICLVECANPVSRSRRKTCSLADAYRRGQFNMVQPHLKRAPCRASRRTAVHRAGRSAARYEVACFGMEPASMVVRII